jgi:hypothetical protein
MAFFGCHIYYKIQFIVITGFYFVIDNKNAGAQVLRYPRENANECKLR